jgi:hypothetical protein
MIASLAWPSARPQPLGGHIAFALIPKAVDDLLGLQDRTGLSRTDVVNRAIISYAFIDEQTRAGQEILIRDKNTRETQLVRFI